MISIWKNKFLLIIFRVGLEKCWASSSETSNNTSSPIFVFFDNKCPLAGIPWIKQITETTDKSKINTRAISVIQFAFTTAKPEDSFYYHCKVILINRKFVSDLCVNNLKKNKFMKMFYEVLLISMKVPKISIFTKSCT